MRSSPSLSLVVFVLPLSVRRFATAAQCSLCGNGNRLPGLALDDASDSGGLTCSQLVNALPGIDDGTQDCDNLQLAAFQTGCCGEESDIPSHVCTVCPDATLPLPEIQIPGSQGRRDLTCGELTSEPAFLDYFTEPGDCSDTFLQRSAAWCKCPGVEIECTLCPDGRRPPNPGRMEHVLYGWTCQSFEFVTALLSRNECPKKAELFEFDAAAFCCPSELSPPPGVCNFCPDGQHVANRNKLIPTEFGSLTCGEIDESLSLIPTEKSCQFTLEKFSSEECCVDGYSTSGDTASSATSSNSLRLWDSLFPSSVVVFFLVIVL